MTVDPKNPSFHRFGLVTKETLEEDRQYWIWTTLLCSGMIQLAYFVVMFRTRREVNALRNYVALNSTVIDKGELSRGKRPTQKVTFRYQSPAGNVIDRPITLRTNLSDGVQIGYQVTLLMNPEKEDDVIPLFALSMAEISGQPEAVAAGSTSSVSVSNKSARIIEAP